MEGSDYSNNRNVIGGEGHKLKVKVGKGTWLSTSLFGFFADPLKVIRSHDRESIFPCGFFGFDVEIYSKSESSSLNLHKQCQRLIVFQTTDDV